MNNVIGLLCLLTICAIVLWAKVNEAESRRRVARLNERDREFIRRIQAIAAESEERPGDTKDP